MVIKYFMTINAPVLQLCPFDLALPVKEESEGFGITRHLLAVFLLPIWGTVGCGCLSFAISFWHGPLKPMISSLEKEFMSMS